MAQLHSFHYLEEIRGEHQLGDSKVFVRNVLDLCIFDPLIFVGTIVIN